MNAKLKKRLPFVLAGGILLAASAAAPAATLVNVDYEQQPEYNIVDLVRFDANGVTMTGITVTAFFEGGGQATENWVPGTIGSGSGGAFGNGWSVSIDGSIQTGDTLFSPWIVEVFEDNEGQPGPTLSGLRIDGGVDVVFDVLFDITDEHSINSGLGREITSLTGPSDLDVSATYKEAVRVAGVFNPNSGDPITDLWHILELEFSNGGLENGETLTFVADTDIAVIPAPATFGLMGVGLAVIGFASRRRIGSRSVRIAS